MRDVTTMRASRPATPPTAMMATTLVERPPSLPDGPDIVIERWWLALAEVWLTDAVEGGDNDWKRFV